MEKKIIKIVSWGENPDWNKHLTKYALSLSSAQLASHIEAIKAEIERAENPPNILVIACSCFVSILKRKLDL